jgi:c-di-GMP-binding flagellar brake protein YcgR
MTPPPQPPPHTQRRQHARTAVRMSAEIHVDETTFTAVTRDLSEGGVGLESDRALAEGDAVTLALFMVVDDIEEEKLPPLWVKGRVAWSGELDDGRHIAGIRFEVITDDQRHWVRQVTGSL